MLEVNPPRGVAFAVAAFVAAFLVVILEEDLPLLRAVTKAPWKPLVYLGVLRAFVFSFTNPTTEPSPPE